MKTILTISLLLIGMIWVGCKKESEIVEPELVFVGDWGYTTPGPTIKILVNGYTPYSASIPYQIIRDTIKTYFGDNPLYEPYLDDCPIDISNMHFVDNLRLIERDSLHPITVYEIDGKSYEIHYKYMLYIYQ